MTINSGSKNGKSLGILQTVVSAILLFSPPALASGAAILALPVFGFNSRIYKPVGVAFLLLCLTSVFAASATYFGGGDTEFKDTKFFLMGVCLIAGLWAQASIRDIRRLASVLAVLIVIWFAINGLAELDLPPDIYPPNNNLSAITLFFLAFIVSERTSLPFRIGLIAFLFLFSALSDSRMLLILLPMFLLSQPISLSFRHVALLTIITTGVLLWSLNAHFWGSWSDLVRLEVYSRILKSFVEEGIPLIARGEDNFVYNLNLMMPAGISQRVTLDHAHNALAHILGSYGVLAGLCFSGAMLSLLSAGYKLKDETLRNQMVFLLAAMMIETVISDSRAAYIVFLFIGLRVGSAVLGNATPRYAAP